jgi:cysteine-rich repeat protein
MVAPVRTVIVAAVLGVLAPMGCVSSSSVTCGERVCPHGTTCVELMESANDPHLCVDPDAITACDGVTALDGCTAGGVAAGACYATLDGEVCLESGCGNGLVDKAEVCDDGNADVGDGCSVACRSDETCGNMVVDPVSVDDLGNLTPNEVCDDGNDIDHDGCSSSCQAETATWCEVSPTLPEERIEAPIVYDPFRLRVIVFGGANQDRQTGCSPQPCVVTPPSPRGGTWESDGVAWRPARASLEPNPRFGAAMAFDAERRVTVMFGGNDGNLNGDTWLYNGLDWTSPRTQPAPSARESHGMTYDAKRKVVVLFGGRDGSGFLSDTWEWDGATWTQVSPAGSIPAQEAMAMTYDPVRAVVVMIGADADGNYTTWEYDGTTWTQKATSDVTPQVTSIAFDAVAQRVVTFGYQSTSGSGTYVWDGTAWTDVPGTQPPVFSGSIASTPDGHVMLFGGEKQICGGLPPCNVRAQNTTYTWDGADWTVRPIVVPVARRGARAALDTAHGTIVMVGGTSLDSSGVYTPYQETWEFDGFRWTLFDSQPWARGAFDAAIAYDSGRDEIVVFGGSEVLQGNISPTHKNDTWIRKDGVWTQASPPVSPQALTSAAMAYDPVRKQAVLFGGDATLGIGTAKTWLWDGATWTDAQPPDSSPPMRSAAAMAWDPVAQEIVLFGGASGGAFYRDTWTWDGTSWTAHVTTSGPTARRDAQLSWDAARGALVLYGGETSIGWVDDSWEWSGGEWHALVAASPPAPRSGHAQAALPDGSGIFVFGGQIAGDAYGSYQDTHELRWKSSVAEELCTLDVDDDGDGLTACADPDCWSRCTPECPPGAPCDAAAPRCGDSVCNEALEDCRTCPGDCSTCASQCGDAICDPDETAAGCPGDCTL